MSVFMLFVSLCFSVSQYSNVQYLCYCVIVYVFSVSQYSNVSIYVICFSVFQCGPGTVMSVFMLFVSLCFSVSQYSYVSIYVIGISMFQCVPVQLCQYLCYLYLCVSVCPSTVMSVSMLSCISVCFSVSQYSNVSIYVICISVFQCVPVQ